MGDWDREKLESELRERQRRGFDLDQFIKETLQNFAHRYLSQGKEVSLSEIQGEGKCYGIKSLEREPPVVFLSEKSSQEVTGNFLCELSVHISKGECQVVSAVHQEEPASPFTEKGAACEKEVIEFDEWIELRTKLPLALEKVCSLFS